MVEPMTPLPAQADDSRLDGWYHTMNLAPGVTTRAVFDHRPIVDRVGLPKSLAGMSALDVATADGFWAFELERRGASPVVAIDVAQPKDFDLTPSYRATKPESWLEDTNIPRRFATARSMLGSKVDYRNCSVYDLSPETTGTFDVVYCGSLLLHLFNPMQALLNIRRVTKKFAVIETASPNPDVETFDKRFPNEPLVTFGARRFENVPGDHVVYWRISMPALCDMLIYAGFSRVEPQGQFLLSGHYGEKIWVVSAVAHV